MLFDGAKPCSLLPCANCNREHIGGQRQTKHRTTYPRPRGSVVANQRRNLTCSPALGCLSRSPGGGWGRLFVTNSTGEVGTIPTTRLPRTEKICIFQGRSREGAVRSFLQQCSERVDRSNHGAGTQNGCTLAWYRILTWRVEILVVAIYTPPLRRLRIILEQFVSANAGTRCSCASDESI